MAKEPRLIAVKRKLETPLSARVIAALGRQGILAMKMSDRWTSGLPDIYVQGGNWIESKVVPAIVAGINGKHPIKHFSPAQITQMQDLNAAGDECFVAVMFVFSPTQTAFVFMPFWDFERITRWTLQTISSLGIFLTKGEKIDVGMERFFDREHPALFDPSIWWDNALKQWMADYPGGYRTDWTGKRDPVHLDYNEVKQGIAARRVKKDDPDGNEDD